MTGWQGGLRIREKLRWKPGILNGNGWKPKGMHWNTFERLTAQHDAFVRDSLAGMAAKLSRKLRHYPKSRDDTGEFAGWLGVT